MMERPAATALPFLARLAAAARDGARGVHGVRAALPSRFGQQAAADPLAEAPVVPAQGTATAPSAPTVSAAANPQPGPASAAARPPADRHAGEPVVRVASAPPPPAPSGAVLHRNEGRAPRSSAGDPEPRSSAPRADTRAARLDAPEPPPSRPVTEPAQAPRPGASQPWFGAAVALPLSDAALAQRVGPQAAAQPVVRVTIDRIDVRMPPSAPAPPPVTKPRGAATVPLGDYLRQRDRSGNGGAP